MTPKQIEQLILLKVKFSEPIKISFQKLCELLNDFQIINNFNNDVAIKENFTDIPGHFGSPFEVHHKKKGEISNNY